jgi:hypothetical protein
VNAFRSKVILAAVLIFFFALCLRDLTWAQAQTGNQQQETQPQLKLRKTLKTREYQGKQVEGEERVVGRGDSLWKFLVQEKGVAEKQFSRYVAIIGTLNPHLKNPNVLEVGDTVFIPIRPDEILGIMLPTGPKGETKIYSVKPGDYLFKILREQLGIKGEQERMSTFKQVRDMNPKKKNWDILLVGEALTLPGRWIQTENLAAQEVKKPPQKIIESDSAQKLPLQGNIPLLEQIIAALGSETRRSGEETLSLQEGVIRIDRQSYPVIESAKNPQNPQKLILDLKDAIPPDLKTKIEGGNSSTRVVSAKPGSSLQETVSGLLSGLGFQSLPANRPVVMQDAGVGVTIKGDWMVTAADNNNSSGAPEMLIISLVEPSTKTPDYLKEYLAVKGVTLKEIVLPQSLSSDSASLESRQALLETQTESWPAEKSALTDAFLKFYRIPFSANRPVSVPLREGITIEITIDRLFEFGGKKTALLFHRMGDEAKKALQSTEKVRVIELDLQAISSRDLISRLLESIGEQTTYQQHRFPATEGKARDKMVLTVAGFFVPNSSLLLTDSQIPKALERFFSEKGLRVIRFR